MAKRYGQACPVAKSLEVVGERWTLLIVRDLLRGPARFQNLRQSLPGIPPKLLSERLKFMENEGLVARKFYSDHPPRAEYWLTDKGRELGLIVSALATWGSRHAHRQTGPVHADCGHPVDLIHYCARCRERVRPSSVQLPKPPAAKVDAERRSR